MPHSAAGMRTLPPVSLPSPPRIRPAATPVPVPTLDPPGQRSMSHGLRWVGNGPSASGAPIANSIVVVLPVMTAPCARRRATTGASTPRPQSGSSTLLHAVVAPSRAAMMSFTPSGMPCNGPRSTPAAKSASACAGRGERGVVEARDVGAERRVVRVGAREQQRSSARRSTPCRHATRRPRRRSSTARRRSLRLEIRVGRQVRRQEARGRRRVQTRPPTPAARGTSGSSLRPRRRAE